MMRRLPVLVARAVVLIAAVATFVAPAVAGAIPGIPGSETKDGLIWLPIYSDGSVKAIDPATNKVVVTIPNAADHPLVVRVNADGTKLFVNSFGPFTWDLTVIDVPTRSVIKRIPTLGAPYAVTQMSHDRRFLYVPTQLSVVDVIDTSTLQVVRTLPVLLPPGPAHLEVTNDDKSLLVMSAPGFLTKYDAVTGAIQGPPLFLNGFAPGWGALSVDGDTVYAINYYASITAVNTKDWYVERIIPTGFLSNPISGTISPDGKTMWICNIGENHVLVMDPKSGHIIRRIDTKGAPVYAGFSADGTKAYISNAGPTVGSLPDLVGVFKLPMSWLAEPLNIRDSTMDVYDTATGALLDQVPVGGPPIAGAYPG